MSRAPASQPNERPSGGVRAATLVALGLLVSACSVRIAGDLNDDGANQVVTALEASGIAATRAPDPDRRERWAVEVAREEAAAAAAVLTCERLPPRKGRGVAELVAESGLVPSRATEAAQLAAATAGEIEQTLSEIDGIVHARVHLALPTLAPLARKAPARAPSASVLITHGGAELPLPERSLQRLVAGAVTGLAPEDVTVIPSRLSAPPPRVAKPLVRFGPVAVADGSIAWARGFVGLTIALNLVLLGAVLALWKGRRNRRGRDTRGSAAKGGT